MIITKKEINDYCRACSTDEAVANGCIFDVETAIIKPSLGIELYNRVSDNPTEYEALLYGCEWTDAGGRVKFHEGLVRAEAYYAYGRILRSGNITATRYGAVQKNGDYSNPAMESQVSVQAGQINATAEMMFARVLDYCKDMGLISGNKQGGRNNNYIKVYKIGE